MTLCGADVKRYAMWLIILGALNWGIVALTQKDVFAHLEVGGTEVLGVPVQQIVYGLIGGAGLYCLKDKFE